MVSFLTNINPENSPPARRSGCIQGFKIHGADGNLRRDMSDCGENSRYGLIIWSI